MFFHSVGCLFTLLIAPFDVQRLFSLIQSHFSIFIFAAYAFGGHIQKIIAQANVKKLFPYVF